MTHPPKVSKGEWVLVGLLLAWGVFVHYYHLDGPVVSDEAMYATVGRWIARTHQWLHLQYDGAPFLYKPPLHFWMIAAAISLWGPGDFAVRFPSATFGMATMLLVYFAGRSMFGARVGVFASLVLTTTFTFAWLAPRAKMDVELGFLMNLAFFAFYLGYRGERRKTGFLWLSFASMAVATMLKGPIGFILPGLGAVVYLTRQRRGAVAGELPLLSLLTGGFLLITAIYYWQLGASFNRYFFGTENLARLVEHSEPFPFYFYIVFAEWLPWSLFIPALAVYAWRSYRRSRREPDLVVWLWLLAFFLPLTLPSYKEQDFLVYSVPPFALLMATYWNDRMLRSDGSPLVEKRLISIGGMLLSIGGVIAVLVAHILVPMRFPGLPAFLPVSVKVVIVLACVATAAIAYSGKPATVLGSALVVSMAVAFAMVEFFYPARAKYVTAKRIGEEVRSIARGADVIVAVSRGRPEILYYLDQDQPVPAGASLEQIYSAFQADRKTFGLLDTALYDALKRLGPLSLEPLAEYSYSRSRYVLVTNRRTVVSSSPSTLSQDGARREPGAR